MLNGVLWVLCLGAAWRDKPERFGLWSTVYQRFRDWRNRGMLKRLYIRLNERGLGTRDYAERTLKEIKLKLARYREDPGYPMMGQLDVLTAAEYLKGFENNAYTKHRGLLVQIFAFAVAKGLCERNSAELTLVKKEAEKKRQRHTVEGLSTILNYVGTPIWLKRAIRLGLLSLQQREDIVMWPKSAVDLEQNTIKVSPGKTQNYGKPVHLEIAMGPALREVVAECMRSPVVCPYLIHYSPKARKRSQLDAKLHWNTSDTRLPDEVIRPGAG